MTIPSMPHHVRQESSSGAELFRVKADFSRYVTLLAKYAHKHECAIWSYCLMPDHIHLIAAPYTEEALSATIRDTHASYSYYFARQYSGNRSLWKGRFSSCVLDHEYLWVCLRHVLGNPVRANLVAHPAEWPWSSAALHIGHSACKGEGLGLLPDSLNSAVDRWHAWLTIPEPSGKVEMLRRRTRTGCPCGSDWFVKQLERRSGRTLLPVSMGRQRHNTNRRIEK